MCLNKFIGLISFLFTFGIAISISSCSDDDSEDSKIEEISKKDGISIQIDAASEVTDVSATLSASYTTKEGQPDKVGFIIGKSSDISITKNDQEFSMKEVASPFSKSVSGLQQLTTYYYKAYALYNDKFYYSKAMSFTTEKEKEAPAKITLVSRDGMSMKVKYEISPEVEYYYAGKGTNISKTSKYTAEKTVSYSDLTPGKDYTFTVIAYTKDGQECAPIRATFSTASSPYTNYLCADGEFYPFSSMEMREDYDYVAVNNTGTNWRYLTLYISDDEYVQFSYGVHQWEYVSDWKSGTFKITDSSAYYSYNGYYYDGRHPKWFDTGSLTIKIQSGTYTVDFTCENYGTRYIGHVVAKS